MGATDWESLERLFERACKLSTDERTAFLERVGAVDPEARAELAALLLTADEADRFFDGLADAMLSLPPWRGEAPGAEDPDPDRLLDRSVRQYRIRKELGRGGMGVVYEAHDKRLDRTVALKFLPPHWSVDAEATERFLVEARAAAALDHPNVCTVYEIGEDEDGRLFIALAHYEGETLAHKLERGALPLEEALEYFRQIAAGLAAAHARGVVHRDIKPANVMVTDKGVAKVLDFGLAKLGGATHPGSGVVRGTVAYMSPEQIRGEVLDDRTDLWSLGVVLYEMLTGERPFRGEHTEAVLHRILHDDPERPTALRPQIPTEVEAVMSGLLAKDPADRRTTAEKLARSFAPEPALAPASGARSWIPLTAAVAAVGLLAGGWWVSDKFAGSRTASELAGGGLLIGVSGDLPRAPDANVVAVFPFRVSEADTTLAYVGEGIVDVLAATLTGELGPRAVDPRTAIGAWRRARAAGGSAPAPPDLARLAQTVGAGRFIEGSVEGFPAHLVINASLRDATSGRVVARATIEGSETNLSNLVELTRAQLVADADAVDGKEMLAGAPLDALRAYMAGQTAYRQGRYREAASRFIRTLELDSTFAVAGIGLASASAWITDRAVPGFFEALDRAWAARGRLSPADLAMLQARMPEEYSGALTLDEKVTAWIEALRLAPDRPDAWYEYADLLFHRGQLLGLPQDMLLEQTASAYGRALQLDSAFAAPLSHLVEIAAIQGDAERLRDLGGLYAKLDSAGDTQDFIRWRTARLLRDSATLAELRARFDELPLGSLSRIAGASLQDGLGLDDAERAVGIMGERATTPTERSFALMWRHHLELNRGRSDTAEAIARTMSELDPRTTDRLRIYAGMYWGGRREAAAAAAARLADRAIGPFPGDREERSLQYRDVCAVEQWNLRNGRQGSAASAIRRLRSSRADRDDALTQRDAQLSALVLDLLLATATNREDAPTLLRSIDSLMLTGPVGLATGNNLPSIGFGYVNLLLSELWEARGRPDASLRAARRRPYIFTTSSTRFLSSYLRQEGRMASRLGDQEGAIRAYRHYLALRSGAEGTAAAEVARVREELAELERSIRVVSGGSDEVG